MRLETAEIRGKYKVRLTRLPDKDGHARVEAVQCLASIATRGYVLHWISCDTTGRHECAGVVRLMCEGTLLGEAHETEQLERAYGILGAME